MGRQNDNISLHSPAKAEPTKVSFLGESHIHSSQHFPGTLTRLGMGQSGLGSRMSMEQSGTQPTAPSRQVHWYLQLLWKDSPFLYTMPPNTQVAPSRAAGTNCNLKVKIEFTLSGRLMWCTIKKNLAAHLCTLQCVYWWGLQSHSRVPCGGHICLSQCRARPSVWHTPCNSHSHPAPGSLLGDTAAGSRGRNTGCYTLDLQPGTKDTCTGKYHEGMILLRQR